MRRRFHFDVRFVAQAMHTHTHTGLVLHAAYYLSIVKYHEHRSRAHERDRGRARERVHRTQIHRPVERSGLLVLIERATWNENKNVNDHNGASIILAFSAVIIKTFHSSMSPLCSLSLSVYLVFTFRRLIYLQIVLHTHKERERDPCRRWQAFIPFFWRPFSHRSFSAWIICLLFGRHRQQRANELYAMHNTDTLVLSPMLMQRWSSFSGFVFILFIVNSILISILALPSVSHPSRPSTQCICMCVSNEDSGSMCVCEPLPMIWWDSSHKQ